MQAYQMIVGYLQAGGTPNVPFITKFCEQHDIKMEEFTKTMANPSEASLMEERLKKVGLIPS